MSSNSKTEKVAPDTAKLRVSGPIEHISTPLQDLWAQYQSERDKHKQALIDLREFGDILRALAGVDSSDLISDSSDNDGTCVLCFADMSIFDETPRPHDRLCPYQLAVELKEAGRI